MDSELKPRVNTKPTTAEALRDYLAMLKKDHGWLGLAPDGCPKCERIRWVELLVEEAERQAA